MIHGHKFYFSKKDIANLSENEVVVEELHKEDNFVDNFKNILPWIPLSGQEGRYFSNTLFEEAGETFSWGLEIKNVMVLIWEHKERKIKYIKKKNFTKDRLKFWIYHTFFPLTLDINKTYNFFHTGTVVAEGKTIMFSAPSFGGKSTITDYFLKKGSELMSDDSIAIEKREGKYLVIPSYPYHRPYRKPEVLGEKAKKMAKAPKEINAIFVLKKTDPKNPVNINEIKGVEKIKALHDAMFINFPFRKKEKFIFFGEMAKNVLIYEITIPWDKERLDEVYREIMQKIN